MSTRSLPPSPRESTPRQRTPGRTASSEPSRERLPALRPERRRALREDGPQRHRVRDDGLLRRGPQHLAQCQCRKARRRQGDAETAPLAEPEFYQFDIDTTAVAEVWRRGSVVGSWLLDLTATALFESPELPSSPAGCPTPVRVAGPRSRQSTKACRPRCSRARCYSRFASRGLDNFANKVLSAMRKGFGGHDEKAS